MLCHIAAKPCPDVVRKAYTGLLIERYDHDTDRVSNIYPFNTTSDSAASVYYKDRVTYTCDFGYEINETITEGLSYTCLRHQRYNREIEPEPCTGM